MMGKSCLTSSEICTDTPIDMAELHKPPFEKINVNGRVPAIEDPNTGITLWESGAIIEYLQETYDKNNTLNYTSTPEKYLVKQWLHFQVSRFLCYFAAEILSHDFQSLFHKFRLLFLDKSQY